MRIDVYTKAVLTVIAAALSANAIKSWAGPDVHAQAIAPSSALQIAVTPVGYSFFDPHTGDLWEYSGAGVHAKFRLTKPGMPLVKDGR